ncbi:ATP binding domain 4 [Seminavis robusta]|uniref:Diphthine--ammonia ligase n=1 Tax=Seminavis robusta TaxID=568900 RepID=A0A9N8EEL9_9STRA|nr:ATP binding domain 4 [Seminavis robusta]|eukprot:Sro1069_g237620.1 ATP binding domain 4 (840) ;mRNA; r:25173-27692
MKFVALVSGGKDSVYSILECCRLGHELLACVHLGAPPEQEEESYMYQSAASEALTTLVEECLGVPLIHYRRVGKSLQTDLVYQQVQEGDEVEDLFQALTLAKEKFPTVQAVSSGAILSTYQRTRIEHVCSRLSLTSLSYLWRAAPQHDLLDRMIKDGITAVLVRAACPPGLKPHKHLNKTLQELQPLFLRLNQLYQFHVCGEGGEYESLVLDCPLYKKRLVLDLVEVVELEGDEGVGVLRILQCHAEEKDNGDSVASIMTTTEKEQVPKESKPIPVIPSGPHSSTTIGTPTIRPRYLPRVRFLGGSLWHVSEIMVPITPTTTTSTTEVDLAVWEAKMVLEILDTLLKRHGCTPLDVMFVHLYLSEISHFASINTHYRQFFGTLLPPSRSCVAIGRNVLPGGRRVFLDCLVQCGSGAFLRTPSSSSFPALRQVLHVQSISRWAPVCVGPYSQVNTLREVLHFCAGQIGLQPATMTLHPQWSDQLHQCWTNVASVLDALGGCSLDHLLSTVVYVADGVYYNNSATASGGDSNESSQEKQHAIYQIEDICRYQMKRNGGIVTGKVDSPIAEPPDNDDDDEEDTDGNEHNTTKLNCPLLVVSIPEMPVGAVVEVEVIAATQKAAACLPRTSTWFSSRHIPLAVPNSGQSSAWDTGHDFFHKPSGELPEVEIGANLCTLGFGSAGFGTVTARVHSDGLKRSESPDLDTEQVLLDMIGCLENALSAESEGVSVGPSLSDMLHVRLFYLGATIDNGKDGQRSPEDDGILLRSSLQSAFASKLDSSIKPAFSVVPVQAIHLIQLADDETTTTATAETVANTDIILAIQVLLLNPVSLESDLWIHHGK